MWIQVDDDPFLLWRSEHLQQHAQQDAAVQDTIKALSSSTCKVMYISNDDKECAGKVLSIVQQWLPNKPSLGAVGVMMILGTPNIGKTTLLNAIKAHAFKAGMMQTDRATMRDVGPLPGVTKRVSGVQVCSMDLILERVAVFDPIDVDCPSPNMTSIYFKVVPQHAHSTIAATIMLFLLQVYSVQAWSSLGIPDELMVTSLRGTWGAPCTNRCHPREVSLCAFSCC
jgi:hypothetical protein